MADEEEFDGLDELPSSPSPDTIKGKKVLLQVQNAFSFKVNKKALRHFSELVIVLTHFHHKLFSGIYNDEPSNKTKRQEDQEKGPSKRKQYHRRSNLQKIIF